MAQTYQTDETTPAVNPHVKSNVRLDMTNAKLTGEQAQREAEIAKIAALTAQEQTKARILQQLQPTAQHGFRAPTMRDGLVQASEPQAMAQKFAQGLVAGQVTPEQTMAKLGTELGSAALQMADQMMGQSAQQQPIPQEIGLGGQL